MRIILIISFCITLCLSTVILCSSCENGRPDFNCTTEEIKGYRIIFWNTENLFDYLDDSAKDDNEFLPGSMRNWTKERYRKKLMNVYKVIVAAGIHNPPEIIGLCEIENRKVILDLLKETPLKFYQYRFVHHESPDKRGIDVALIYNSQFIEIVEEYAIGVNLQPAGGETRDILYVRIAFKSADTISFFINHWPSKYGGSGFTEDSRRMVAEKLRDYTSSVLRKFPSEKIIIMGDFNDPPESNSISGLVCDEKNDKYINGDFLYNLSNIGKARIYGTNKYQGIWEIIDQFIVSGNCIKDTIGLYTGAEFFSIFSPDFLLEDDKVYGGKKPFRTWNGMKYQGGFSDHLPVILDLKYREL